MTVPTPLILHVIHHLVIGGMENGLVNIINRMPSSTFRHAIACIEDYSDFRQRISRPDVEVFPLYRSRTGVWGVRLALFRLCRRLRPTIVHSRGLSGLDALLPATLAGVRHRVHGEHGWDVADLEGRKYRPAVLRRLHAPFVDHYIAVSKHLERYLRERIGIAASRITQVYNGVDTERFTPASAKPHAVLPANFAEADSIIIGTIGRLQAVKDQATLVRAFATLAQRSDDVGRRVRLAIIGDGPMTVELRSLVETLGVSRKTWMPGSVANVPDAMRAFDLFVLPSLQEGTSNTILEAMACGLPVVATAVGGNVELVDANRTGRLFEPRDTAMLAQLLTEYALNDSLRRSHSLAGRSRAVEMFALGTMINNYQRVYEQLCKG
jgi:sugar transferase (PEP-CTERM/EpsH1 system associated)